MEGLKNYLNESGNQFTLHESQESLISVFKELKQEHEEILKMTKPDFDTKFRTLLVELEYADFKATKSNSQVIAQNLEKSITNINMINGELGKNSAKINNFCNRARTNSEFCNEMRQT